MLFLGARLACVRGLSCWVRDGVEEMIGKCAVTRMLEACNIAGVNRWSICIQYSQVSLNTSFVIGHGPFPVRAGVTLSLRMMYTCQREYNGTFDDKIISCGGGLVKGSPRVKGRRASTVRYKGVSIVQQTCTLQESLILASSLP